MDERETRVQAAVQDPDTPVVTELQPAVRPEQAAADADSVSPALMDADGTTTVAEVETSETLVPDADDLVPTASEVPQEGAPTLPTVEAESAIADADGPATSEAFGAAEGSGPGVPDEDPKTPVEEPGEPDAPVEDPAQPEPPVEEPGDEPPPVRPPDEPEGESAAAGPDAGAAPAEDAEVTTPAIADADHPADVAESVDDATEGGTETVSADQLLMGTEQPEADTETDEHRKLAILEAIVYVTDEPLTREQIAKALGEPLPAVTKLLDKLAEEFNKPHHGLTVKEVAGGFKMATKAEHHEAVRTFVKNLNPPLKLSLAALETLAVIAYKQPITAPEIMEIRGVQGAGVLKTLIDRKLITTAGRKNVVGKPILYKTTKEFLVQFGLRDLAELPTLKEFEDLRRMAFTEADAPADVVDGTPVAEAASEAKNE